MKLQRCYLGCLLGVCLAAAGVLWSAGAGGAAQESAAAVPAEPDPGNLRTFIELVRRDIKTQKAFILAQNMEFTEAEAVDFWPLYEQYEGELDTLTDQRLALIRKYLAVYDTLTDEQARQLAAESLSLEEQRTALKRKYFPEFAAVITARKAVRFFQIENQLNAAIDLRLAASLPLIK
jgi:hypothetical protein